MSKKRPAIAAVKPRKTGRAPTLARDVGHNRSPASQRQKGFNWKSCLIESLIAIGILNVIAWIVMWYFILPRLNR